MKSFSEIARILKELPELLAAVKELRHAAHEFVSASQDFSQKYHAVEAKLAALGIDEGDNEQAQSH
jgi:hypothetical protein